MLDLTFKKHEELMFSSAEPSKLYTLNPLYGTDSTGILSCSNAKPELYSITVVINFSSRD